MNGDTHERQRKHLPTALYWAAGVTAFGLAVLALHDDQKRRVRDVVPWAWDWALRGCVVGRSEAVESVPALLIAWIGVAAFWFARKRAPEGGAWALIASIAFGLSALVAMTATLIWVVALTVGLRGSC